MSGEVRAALSDLFDAARRAEIEPIAGERLFRSGRRMRGPCPICGASQGKRADGAFSADPRSGLWTCFACEAGGDVIALEQALRGGSAQDAAARLAPAEALRVEAAEVAAYGVARARPAAAPRLAPPRRAEAEPPPADDGFARRLAARLWLEAEPAGGTLVERYLAARGIAGDILAEAANRVRFHPAAHHGWDGRAAVTAPAMIALVRTPAGPTGGVHATYLDALGPRKASLQPRPPHVGAAEPRGPSGRCVADIAGRAGRAGDRRGHRDGARPRRSCCRSRTDGRGASWRR